jgi:DnaK suppressor protein
VEGRTAILRRELEELRAQITALERALEEEPDYGLDNGVPAVTQQELDQAPLQRCRERAASIERVLAQMIEGTHGICEQCGRPIHPDRLVVLPDTRVCIYCARADERAGAG